MLKIVAISDTHKYYSHLNMPEGDILIHAGDIDIYDNLSELHHFKKWLDKQKYKEKIVIGGNHDRMLSVANGVCRSILEGSCHYLENSEVVIKGIKFWGSPITPTFCNWFFMANRGAEIKRYWDMIPEDTNILITHGPPYGIFDDVPISLHHNLGVELVGCKDLRNKVMEMPNLKVHIFGHIHRDKGVERVKQIGKTKFINASVLDDNYELVNGPVVIEI